MTYNVTLILRIFSPDTHLTKSVDLDFIPTAGITIDGTQYTEVNYDTNTRKFSLMSYCRDKLIEADITALRDQGRSSEK